MGSWQLEIAKMALYIGFPIVMFHFFNQPHLFEKWVIDLRREMYPHDSDPDVQKMRIAIEEYKREQQNMK